MEKSSSRLGWTPIPKDKQGRILDLWSLYKDYVGFECELYLKLMRLGTDDPEKGNLEDALENHSSRIEEFNSIKEDL